jgi:hypothetical protein
MFIPRWLKYASRGVHLVMALAMWCTSIMFWTISLVLLFSIVGILLLVFTVPCALIAGAIAINSTAVVLSGRSAARLMYEGEIAYDVQRERDMERARRELY